MLWQVLHIVIRFLAWWLPPLLLSLIWCTSNFWKPFSFLQHWQVYLSLFSTFNFVFLCTFPLVLTWWFSISQVNSGNFSGDISFSECHMRHLPFNLFILCGIGVFSRKIQNIIHFSFITSFLHPYHSKKRLGGKCYEKSKTNLRDHRIEQTRF
jgi:hypothetical protein